MDKQGMVMALSVELENNYYNNIENYLAEYISEREDMEFSFKNYDYITLECTQIGANIPEYVTITTFITGYTNGKEVPLGEYIMFHTLSREIKDMREAMVNNGDVSLVKSTTNDAINLMFSRMDSTFNRDLKIFSPNDGVRYDFKRIKGEFSNDLYNRLEELYLSLPDKSGLDKKKYYVSIVNPRLVLDSKSNEVKIMLKIKYYEPDSTSVKGYKDIKTVTYFDTLYKNVYPLLNKTELSFLDNALSVILEKMSIKHKSYKCSGDRKVTILNEDDLQGWLIGKGNKNDDKIMGKLLNTFLSKDKSAKIIKSEKISISGKLLIKSEIKDSKDKIKTFILGTGGIVSIDSYGKESVILSKGIKVDGKSTLNDARKNLIDELGKTLLIEDIINCYDNRKNRI